MTDSTKAGLVLFGHGARDVRWAEPFERLRDIVARRHDGPVTLAFLELMKPDLDEAIDAMRLDGCTRVAIVPIFFGQGSHLRRDLPQKVAALRARVPDLEIVVTDAAGEDEAVVSAVADFALRAVSDR